MDLGENNDCTSATFHPGWSFSVAPIGNGWDSGDIATIEINTPFAWDCILDTPNPGGSSIHSNPVTQSIQISCKIYSVMVSVV